MYANYRQHCSSVRSIATNPSTMRLSIFISFMAPTIVFTAPINGKRDAEAEPGVTSYGSYSAPSGGYGSYSPYDAYGTYGTYPSAGSS